MGSPADIHVKFGTWCTVSASTNTEGLSPPFFFSEAQVCIDMLPYNTPFLNTCPIARGPAPAQQDNASALTTQFYGLFSVFGD